MSRNHFKISKGLSISPVVAQPSDPENGDLIYNNTSSQFEKYEGGVWKTLGSGAGGGSVNLVTNGNADDSAVSIFTSYLNTTQSRPVTGAGGSPTVTTSLSSASPLTGTKSFILSKPASNVQGQGWAVPFTVDPSYRAKSLKISVDYIVNSGTFAAGNNSTPSDGDVIWYLYDVTNSQLIEPSNIKMFSSSTTISDSFQATFQTSVTGSSYRLIAHVASTSALAFDLKVDNVTVSPQVYVYGTPVTDLTNTYTATITGGTVVGSMTYTANTLYWKKVGDSIRVTGNIRVATVTTSPTGSIFINLPPGLNWDSNKMSDGGRGSFGTTSCKINSTTIPISFLTISSSTNNMILESGITSPGPFIATDEVKVDFEVPIQGWSSSVQMSDSADTRVISFSGSVSAQALTGATTNIAATTVKDTHGAWTGSTFVVPVSGDYLVGIAAFSTTIGSTYIAYINGSQSKYIASSVANNISGGMQLVPNLKSGDILSVRSLASLTVATDAAQNISISRVSGPQAIAASESVNCRYTNSAGTSIPNTGATLVPFSNKSYDTHGAFSTNIFTVPTAGRYNVKASLTFLAALYTVGNVVYISIYKNGSLYSYGPEVAAMAAVTVPVSVTANDDIDCISGDTIQIYVTNSRTAGSTNFETSGGGQLFNYLCIEKVK